MQPSRKRALEKATLLVAIIGVLIAAAAYINDLRTDHGRSDAPSVMQTTSGANSPAISGVSGDVTVNGGTR